MVYHPPPRGISFITSIASEPLHASLMTVIYPLIFHHMPCSTHMFFTYIFQSEVMSLEGGWGGGGKPSIWITHKRTVTDASWLLYLIIVADHNKNVLNKWTDCLNYYNTLNLCVRRRSNEAVRSGQVGITGGALAGRRVQAGTERSCGLKCPHCRRGEGAGAPSPRRRGNFRLKAYLES